MRWRMDFYHEGRRMLARYAIEAPLPGAAVLLGRRALAAEYPSAPTRGRLSLFGQAQRLAGQDLGGWLLYRIVQDDGAPIREDAEARRDGRG